MSRRARFSSEGGAGQWDTERVTADSIEGYWDTCRQGIHNSMPGVNAPSEVRQGDGERWVSSLSAAPDRTRRRVSGEQGFCHSTGKEQEEARRGGGRDEGEEALAVVRRALLVGGVIFSPACRVREGHSLVVGFLNTLSKTVHGGGKEDHGTRSGLEHSLFACRRGVGQPAQGSADQRRVRRVCDNGPHLREFSQIVTCDFRQMTGDMCHTLTSDSYNAEDAEVVPWEQKNKCAKIDNNEAKEQLAMLETGSPMGGFLFADGVRSDGLESVPVALIGLVLALGFMLSGRGR